VLEEQPNNVKALFRKADALGELCEWRDADTVAALLESTGEEGRKLVAQKRDEWRRRKKAADGKQKKMWSAALSEGPKKTTENAKENAKETAKPMPTKCAEVIERWTAPKVLPMSIFDLRKKGIKWDEKEDFEDSVWRDGLGRREATFYQKQALPLTLLAAGALAELDFQAELVVHCLLDGNTAPFAQPHDWSCFLRRCPAVRSLTVVYVDIGAVADISGESPDSMPYGTLLRPTEEGRVGDRVARSARFLGTYKEFQEHCKELPGLVVPQVALWADVPLYGLNDDDFAVRLEAFQLLASAGVPSVMTQAGEVQEPGGPPITLRLDDQASLSLAVLGVGLAARMLAGWCWNRFVVPLDRGGHGIFAAHALVGIVRPDARSGRTAVAPSAVKKALQQRGINPEPMRPPRHAGQHEELEKIRRQQWDSFCRKLEEAGRPIGPHVSAEERNRQAMEFYQFCGMAGPPSA